MVEQFFSDFLGFYRPNFKVFSTNYKFRESRWFINQKNKYIGGIKFVFN
ncbi:unnamed protein product [Paramecium octaurelia]|uniref:Uncharacterized protein n=1 Tax=Paramecium octaurelia TaxID=43137 RepID=A0A8S1X2J9_PAROT|nr:unnamed protein product [Paramecium octaurelia]